MNGVRNDPDFVNEFTTTIANEIREKKIKVSKVSSHNMHLLFNSIVKLLQSYLCLRSFFTLQIWQVDMFQNSKVRKNHLTRAKASIDITGF